MLLPVETYLTVLAKQTAWPEKAFDHSAAISLQDIELI